MLNVVKGWAEKMKRKEKTDDTGITSKKFKQENTSFSLLPPEIINHILDYSSYTSHDNIHPFALVSKTTRNCWLNHYLSTPYKLITNLIELVNVNNKTFPLDYKLSYFNYLKQVLKTTKVPLKKENERLIEIENKKAQLEIDKINRVQLINRIKQFNLTEIELKEMENIINNHCVDIIITVDDHYEGDILCYFLYTVKFDILDINFSSTFSTDADRYGPGGELTIPEEESKDWDKIINLCKCNLTKERLYKIMEELLDDINRDTFNYKEIF